MENITRRDYSHSQFQLDLPSLLEVQINSYRDFLQEGILAKDRRKVGLEQVFQDTFPIIDQKKIYSLEYDGYSLGVPKYSIKECRERGLTFAMPLKAKLSLYVFDSEEEEPRKFKEKITNDVYICDIPKMTDFGTFIINGAERVVVSQLHRSPGVSFDEDYHQSGKRQFKSRIIPAKGSWVEFVVEINDVLYVNIDRRKKIPATVLLRAIERGNSEQSSNEKILSLFYARESVVLSKVLELEELEGKVLFTNIVDTETGEVIAVSGSVINRGMLNRIMDAGIDLIDVADVSESPLIHNTLIEEFKANQKGREGVIDEEFSRDDALVRIFNVLNGVAADEARRGGDYQTLTRARGYFEKIFFDEKRYDLGDVGRYRLSSRLGLDQAETLTVFENGVEVTLNNQNKQKRVLTLTCEDIEAIVRYMSDLNDGKGELDDIDHLGNRRARSVGELLGLQFATGLTRVSRAIRDKLTNRDQDELTPTSLINARTISSVVQSFFGSSQLSQFMDQTNPLSELTHKRRMSALGPGGLTRERAGFEVRDVHYTHYGRLCPIETPEGPNIGLINSLAAYAVVNPFGFIETPYRVVKDGKVTQEVVFLTADKEDQFVIAPTSTELTEDGTFANDYVIVRKQGEFPLMLNSEVQLMDVSPKQIVSIAAGLIPFLEHDDANRALMGSNMQRQAVPLLRSQAPYVGTGLEVRAARDSGTCILAEFEGEVTFVDATQVVVRRTEKSSEDDILGLSNEKTYELRKYERSNQDTSINQKPVVNVGQKVLPGDVLADGASTDQGELALGKNILIGFIPWNGYNFEDAIIISEELSKDDVFTSIHIEEFELEVRDTKRGPEELTREIPNVSEDSIRNLDDEGIIRVGAEVEAGDILVGKVTPKGETELSPEERLLRAIFGEKAGDVRDSSLKAPPGMKGVVVETRVFSRKERDKKSKEEDKEKTERLKIEIGGQIQELSKARESKLIELLLDQNSGDVRDSSAGDLLFAAGKKWTDKSLSKLSKLAAMGEVDLSGSRFAEDEALNAKAVKMLLTAAELIREKEETLEKEFEKIVRGDELRPGVLKLVKVYIAKKRKLQVGDKMAGRHGNKGVISKVVPVEDMPFLENGIPLQIILNPLGVPSRMNIGQVLEVHLGWAARGMGLKIEEMLRKAQASAADEIRSYLKKIYKNKPQESLVDTMSNDELLEWARQLKSGVRVSTPVFDGAKYEEVVAALELADLPPSGKTRLIDGRTGEFFDTPVTVGYMYMLKLGHLVDDKMHARSIGPYSLVTQQPLGGKSQFGGQRFGEMEVWALEAYGAAYTLQELLTVKSDDVLGRSKIYEAIVKGENTPEPGIPESFNVLIKEIQALGLDIRIGEEE